MNSIILLEFESAYCKTFRDYQADIVDVVGRGLSRADWLIEVPTGGGKTTIAIAILADLMGRGTFTHAVVIAPMTQIEDGFVIRDASRFNWPADVNKPPIDVAAGFVRAARDGNASACREIIEYLKLKNPGYALATTHAAFRSLVANHADGLPDTFNRCLLVVDEAHRTPARGLSGAVAHWGERGGRLLYLTATPHRADGLPVKPPGMLEYRRSMAEHMATGLYSPKKLNHGIVLYGPDDLATTWKEISGQEIGGDPRSLASLATRMVEQWIADGRPKVIVFVPPVRGGSAGHVGTIIGAFQSAGARTLDASGVGTDHQRRFLDGLRAERGLTAFRQSQFDVIVGGPRLPEGTDWPLCSTVYSVGVSGSMREAVQLIGRAMRAKVHSGYPRRHKDVATVKSFVPSATGKALEKMSVEHSRLVLITCVFMADYEAGAGFVLTKAVREALNGPGASVLVGEPRPPVHVDHGLDNETYMAVKVAMAGAVEEDPAATYGDLWDAGRKAAPDAPGRALDVIVAGMMAAGVDSERIAKMVREKIGPETKDLDGVLREMVAELREDQAGAVVELEQIGAQVHKMTGKRMRDLVDRLESGTFIPKTYEWNGIIDTVEGWASRENLDPGLLRYRLNRGMDISEAIQKHVNPKDDRLFEYKGEFFTIGALADKFGMSYSSMYTRLKSGMTPEQAGSKPVRGVAKKQVSYQGETYDSVTALARRIGVNPFTLLMRIRKNGNVEEAITAPVVHTNVPHIEYLGEKYTYKGLARKLGMNAMTLKSRLVRGMSVEEAISKEIVNSRTPTIDYHGKKYTIKSLSEEFRISCVTLSIWLRSGLSPEAASIKAMEVRDRNPELIYQGRSYDLKGLSKILNIPIRRITDWVRSGLGIDEIKRRANLLTSDKIHCHGELFDFKGFANKVGLHERTLKSWLSSGMTPEQVLNRSTMKGIPKRKLIPIEHIGNPE